MRLSTKLLLTILPLAFLAIGTSVYVNNIFLEREMLNQAQVTAQTYGDIVRESLVDMMISRQQIDDEYLKRLNSVRDIRNLTILFHVDNLNLRDVYQSDQRMERLNHREKMAGPINPVEQEVFKKGELVLHRDQDNVTALIPFVASPRCQQCHDVPTNHVLGVARMDISLDRISASINNNWVRSLWVFFFFGLVAIGLSVVAYRILVAKRLKNLIDATKIIGSGNLDQPVTPDSSGDELGDLSSAVENMRSQLKKAQDKLILTDRLSTIGQMAGSIIHDFRSPMSTINLAVASLQQGKNITPEKTEQWYKLIREAIGRMVVMAQELLDFSRGEAHLEKQEFLIEEFMHQVVKSVSVTLEQAKVHLDVEQQCSGPAVFDADRLHRALVNIINNAQDAMPNGGSISVVSSRNNGSLFFSIKDNGIGIPPELMSKIFDAFVTSGKKKGTGLGLAITKRIIDQHGGTIEVESEQGKGTTFRINIPAT